MNEMERSAMPVLRVGGPRLFEGRNGSRTVTLFLAQFAEHEPGRGIGWRKLKRLQEQIGSTREIALGLTVACPLEAAVGNHIAGGKENWAAH
jgi:hypothetical protein